MSDFTTEAFTLLGVGVTIIFLRTYARITTVGLKGMKPDDYIMLLAAVVYSLETATAYSVGAMWHGLANNGMTDEERAALDPNSEEWALRVGGSKTQLVGWSLYTLLLWLLKLSMNIFYIRLTEGVDNMTIRIRIGLVAVVITYIATILSILLGCMPMHKNWQIFPDPGNHCQPAISKIDIYVTVVLNVITDMYLLSIPLLMLWRANLPGRRKILLLVMFGGGIFVTMAGILRCVLILTNPITGAQEAGSWACRETFVAVVTSNIPMIYPLLRRWFTSISNSPIVTSLVGTKLSKYHDSTSQSQKNTYEMENKKSARRAPRSVNPITIGTFAESEERMVPEDPTGGDEKSNSRRKDIEQCINVTTETEVEVHSLDSRSRDRDLHGHYPDGIVNGAKGYNAYVNN